MTAGTLHHLAEALSGRTALYRQIADAIPHLVWVGRADGWIEFVNGEVCEYTGLALADLTGQNWRDVLHPEDLAHCERTWSASLAGGERFNVVCRLRRADGVYRWHSASARRTCDGGGGAARWFGTCTDIEDQVRSAQQLEHIVSARTEALNESERRFRSFMDYAPAIAWIKDAQMRYVYVSKPFERAFGTRLEDVRGKDDFDLWPREVAAALRRTDERARDEAGPQQSITRIPVAGGRMAEWFTVNFPFPDARGAAGVAGVAIDFTEQHQLREALGRSAQQVRTLLDRLTRAQEAERRRLADDLHNLIGQNLTALGIELGILEGVLPPQVAAANEARLREMRRLVEATVGEIRGVMTELRPPALEEYGLVPALRQHAAAFEGRTGIRTRVATAGPGRRMSADIELALFRTCQEALTNVAKHSGARNVRIELLESERLVTLAVHDDGRGFAERVGARAAARGGWGLPAMRERTEALGGALRIRFPGPGTCLQVEIPIRHDNKDIAG